VPPTRLHGACRLRRCQEENWYKPRKGEPYRPLIALPDQIKNLNAKYGTCVGDFFSGVDPPKSLVPGTVMVPTTTSEDPKASIATAMPVSSPDAGAKNTAADLALTGASSTTPTVEQAKETSSMTSEPKQGVPDRQPHFDDPGSTIPQVKVSMQPGLRPQETSSMVLEPKQGVPDPQPHVDGPGLIMPQVKASMQPGLGPQETSSVFRQESSIGDHSTRKSNQDTPNLPFQNIASVPPIVLIDPAPKPAPTNQDINLSNGVPTLTSSEPNTPAHLGATVFATNETPQDPSSANQNPEPDPPRIAGADDLYTRTAVHSVSIADHAIYQSHADPVANLVTASHTAQAGDPAIFLVGIQMGFASSANNIAAGGNNIPTEASALVPAATTHPHESVMLENNQVASPISWIGEPKFVVAPIIGHTTAAAIPTVDVFNTPLLGMLNIATIDGTEMIPATPGRVPTTPMPGAPEPNGQTSSSEALKTKTDDTRNHPNLDSPTGAAGSTDSGDESNIGSPTHKAGNTDSGDESNIGSPTHKAGKVGSTDTIDQSNIGSPTGEADSTNAIDQFTVGSPTGKADSSNPGAHFSHDSASGKVGSINAIPTGKVGSTNAMDQSTVGSPSGKVSSTGSGDTSSIGSPTSKAGGSDAGALSTGDSATGKAGSTTAVDQSTIGSPTGETTRINTSDHMPMDSPTGGIGSTSTGTQISEGTYGTGDHSTLISPTGNVNGTGTGKQILEGQAKSWQRCVGWKWAGSTGLMIGTVL
jgi:hypothetical protein